LKPREFNCQDGTGLEGLAGPPRVGGLVKRGDAPLGSWLGLPFQSDRRFPLHFRLFWKSSPDDCSHGATASQRIPMVVARSQREGFPSKITDRFLQWTGPRPHRSSDSAGNRMVDPPSLPSKLRSKTLEPFGSTGRAPKEVSFSSRSEQRPLRVWCPTSFSDKKEFSGWDFSRRNGKTARCRACGIKENRGK